MCTSSDLVVFSIDLTMTRSLGVMGEFACFKGLKFKMTVKILFAVWGRARMRMEREFKVASTSTASLHMSVDHSSIKWEQTNLIFSWKTDNILSSRPDASASRFLGGMSGLVGWTIDRETSRGSPRLCGVSIEIRNKMQDYPYPRVRIWAFCLYKDDSLGKLDAAYPYTCSSRIPYS